MKEHFQLQLENSHIIHINAYDWSKINEMKVKSEVNTGSTAGAGDEDGGTVGIRHGDNWESPSCGGGGCRV